MKVILVSLFLALVCSVCATINLTILHTNDLHAQYREINKVYRECLPEDNTSSTGCFGGFARIAYKVKQFRNEAKEKKDQGVLYLDAGDYFTGSRLFANYKSKVASEFMNLLKPDALAVGNHELYHGFDQLQAFTESITSPVLTSNLNFKNASIFRNLKKSVVLEVGGQKIGIIGYTTLEYWPKDSEMFDEVAAIKAESERLDKEGVKILIALGNSGFEVDKRIAYYVPLIDIVVGGHSHTFLYSDNPPSSELPVDTYPKIIIQPSRKNVPVVHAFAYSKYLGCLNVTFDTKGDVIAYSGQPLLLASKVPDDTYAFMRPVLEAAVTPQDEEVSDLLKQYETIANSSEVVGSTRITLDADGDACIRRECNFGNLVADSLVSYFNSIDTSQDNVDYAQVVGIIDGRSIRGSMYASTANGTITKDDILYTLPYSNIIMSCSIKGRDLLKTLERNLEFGKMKCTGQFLQFSGLRVVYDLYRPYGLRVVSSGIPVSKDGGPDFDSLKPDGIYRIVSTDYLIESGCNYFINCYDKKSYAVTYSDAVAKYVTENSPIKTAVENRIELLKKET